MSSASEDALDAPEGLRERSRQSGRGSRVALRQSHDLSNSSLAAGARGLVVLGRTGQGG